MFVLNEDLICRDSNRINYRINQYKNSNTFTSSKDKIIQILENNFFRYKNFINEGGGVLNIINNCFLR